MKEREMKTNNKVREKEIEGEREKRRETSAKNEKLQEGSRQVGK